ncbi:DUF4288 domain-containing protein [Pinirhizobacter soli]|nr:DUF4288 domain-containing protein [Pinirhizobacter soli]
MWYCAHAIFYFKYEGQESYLLHENIYLIDAADDDLAWSEAERIAKDNEDLNAEGQLHLNDSKAQYLFAGIRKVIAVETDSETSQGRLFSGVEATYSVMEVDSFSEVESLASGEFTNVLYRE